MASFASLRREGEGFARGPLGVNVSQWAGPADAPDRYELIQVHSRGGEGELWRGAIDLDGVAIPVAVKVLHPGPDEQAQEAVELVQRQAELLRTLDHPNLVTVREAFAGPPVHPQGDADPSQRALYLVMNWVDGESGVEWVARNADRDVLDSIRTIARAADAVDYLHSGAATSRPVLHRDIKPANVMISGKDVRLVDFGLARLLTADPITIAGTPSFLAPEVLAGQPYTDAADRFALGATAFYLLTGHNPDVGDWQGMLAELRAIDGSGGRSDLAEHVLAMMHPDPARRPQSCAAWARTLTAAAVSGSGEAVTQAMVSPPAGHEGTAPPATAGTTPAAIGSSSAVPAAGSGGKRRGPKVAVLAALLVLALGGGAYGAVALGALGGGADDTQATAAATTEEDGEATESEIEEEPVDGTPDGVTAEADEETEELEPEVEAITMPDVVGSHVEDARTQLEDLEITDVTVEQKDSTELPGKVLEQRPAPGAVVNGPVTLVAAATPSELPDAVGQTLREAESLLAAIGIDATVTEVLDPEGVDQTVVGQSPPGGSPYRTEVELEVSREGVSRYLMEVREVEGSISDRGTMTVDGEIYTRSITHLIGRTNLERRMAGFDLGRNFRRFDAVIGLRDDAPSDAVARVEVFADGRTLFDTTLGLGEVEEVRLDVEDVLRLELLSTDLWRGANYRVVFADARVIGLPDEVPDPED
jgi:hypothetical protein